MKIGIIVYSRTNNTLSVAERLKEAIQNAGHTVDIERITAENEDPQSKSEIRLTHIPDTSVYDCVIFGAPVQGFSLSPIMKTYLLQLKQLGGKRIACFVTQHFSKRWMGGRQAMGQMGRLIAKKGGVVAQTDYVNWSSKERETQISGLIENFAIFVGVQEGA